MVVALRFLSFPSNVVLLPALKQLPLPRHLLPRRPLGPSLRFTLLDSNFFTLRRRAQADQTITLFFADTSTSILASLEQVYALLRSCGMWLNLGLLLSSRS
ncbi:hypothetical protein MKEN_00192200 [Mycena kentingensis (nom. inval.)]|nr:hypothetical protein MKEN_00192200 [Mycena kentingensis (nom. inval.)]